MGTSSSIRKGSQVLPQDTAQRTPPSPTPPSTYLMEADSRQLTLPFGSQCGEMTPSTPPSQRERSPDSSIEIWVNGQFSTRQATLTKLTVITSSGKLDLFFETGAMLRVSRISTLPN